LPISAARFASFQILLRIEKDKAFATELLHAEAQASLNARDHRLATELVLGVLRNQTLLDWHLSRFSKISFERLDTEAKMALRLGAYQILMLTRVPVRAAINESVELVKASRARSAKGFVNAVLRKIDRHAFLESLQGLSMKTTQDLSIRYSHPEWLIGRWLGRFDLETVIRLLERNNHPPRTFFRLDCATLSPAAWLEELRRHKIQVTASPLCEDILEVTDGDLHQTTLLRERKILLQDAGSQVIPYLLNPRKNDLCLDLCAAPGGKSSQIAWMTEGEAKVVAMDAHSHRVRTMRKLHGDNWQNVWCIVADGTTSLPFSVQFDKVLVDVPCSGTGTLGRHPEIRWRLIPSALPALNRLQTALLEKASDSVKPGGLLVYSTCSLEPEENEQIITAFLARNPQFHLDLPSDGRFTRFFDPHRYFRLLPSTLGSDGFFAALLRKIPAGR
jgi:16S rRNA (cytosine967-C5)-methyltransferase